MAKPTSEILPLPNFSVPMVRKFDDNFITDDISLADWSKNSRKGLVLYFYPKDNTPGCSTQATDFTDMQHQFDKLGYDVIGVSCDGIDSHKNFIDKKNLQIALISDEDEKLCQYFDVIREKNTYGKKTIGLVRSTFVYDANGNLTHAQRNLKATGHAERLYKTLAQNKTLAQT